MALVLELALSQVQLVELAVESKQLGLVEEKLVSELVVVALEDSCKVVLVCITFGELGHGVREVEQEQLVARRLLVQPVQVDQACLGPGEAGRTGAAGATRRRSADAEHVVVVWVPARGLAGGQLVRLGASLAEIGNVRG